MYVAIVLMSRLFMVFFISYNLVLTFRVVTFVVTYLCCCHFPFFIYVSIYVLFSLLYMHIYFFIFLNTFFNCILCIYIYYYVQFYKLSCHDRDWNTHSSDEKHHQN